MGCVICSPLPAIQRIQHKFSQVVSVSSFFKFLTASNPHPLIKLGHASGKVSNAPGKHFGENRKISARGRLGPAVGFLFALCSSRFALDSFGVRQTQKGTAPPGGPKGLAYGRKCANAGFQIDDRATAAGSMPSSRSIRKASPTVQPHRSAMSWTLASSPLPLARDSASRTPQ